MTNGASESSRIMQHLNSVKLTDWSRRLGQHVARFWSLWVALGLFGFAASVGLETGLDRLVQRWGFPYNHSPLVVGMALWLLLVGLRGVTLPRLAPSSAGFLLLAAVVALYALTEIIDLTLGMQMLLPLVLVAGSYALMGRHMAGFVLVPAGLLYFTVPLWDLTVVPLQYISTEVVSAWVRWTGLTAIIEGYFITIPAGRFEIAEGCSGMRYVVVSLALASFYAMCWLKRWRYRLMLVVVAGLASMLANWIRIYSLILVGHVYGMEHYLIAVSHDEHGWVVFFVCMAPVLWFARRLEAREPENISGGPGAPTVKHVSPAPVILGCALLASALVVSPVLLRAGVPVPASGESLDLIAEPDAGWSQDSLSYSWEPAFHQPHLLGHRAFVSPDEGKVEVYVARYLSQDLEAKLIARRNSLNPGWRHAASDDLSVSIADEQRRVRRTELRSGGAHRLMLSWYVVGGRTATREFQAKLLEIPALLVGRRDGAVIALSAECSESCEAAERLIQAFLEDHGKELEAIADGRQ